MLFSWLKSRRRRKLSQAEFPPGAAAWIDGNVRHARALPPDLRAKLDRMVKVFVAEKSWEGIDGLTVTDEMRYTIAAQAAVLAVGASRDFYFDGVQSILIFPGTIIRRGRPTTGDGVLYSESDHYLEGEAMHRGPIALSWPDVLRGSRGGSGANLVLHEFAHYLDGLDGMIDGAPPLGGRKEKDRWQSVTRREFDRLVAASRQGRATLLDQYGASDPVEFFAVATECFFEQPHEMKHEHAELFDVLRSFFRQDPTEWNGA